MLIIFFNFLLVLLFYPANGQETRLETTLAKTMAALQHCFTIIETFHNNSYRNSTNFPTSSPLLYEHHHPISRGYLARIINIRMDIKRNYYLTLDMELAPEKNRIRLKYTSKNSCLAFIIVNPERPHFGEMFLDITVPTRARQLDKTVPPPTPLRLDTYFKLWSDELWIFNVKMDFQARPELSGKLDKKNQAKN